ncbi:MAG: helix-turn-helix domain-containing protein [Acidimicrobiales bacterium]
MAGPPKPPTPRLRLFGARVRERRTQLGLTQEEMAELAGMHPTYISLVERGLRNPALDNICRIAAALAMNAGDLMWDLDKVKGRRGPHRRSHDPG